MRAPASACRRCTRCSTCSPDDCRIYVEVKQPGIARQVLDVLATHPSATWLIESFDPGILRDARALSPTADLWPIGLCTDVPATIVVGTG